MLCVFHATHRGFAHTLCLLQNSISMKKNYIFAKSNLVNTKLVCEKRVGWGASPSGFFWIILVELIGEVVIFMEVFYLILISQQNYK